MTQPPDKFSEENLLINVSKGDKYAFGVLYERHLKEIYRYIYYRVAEQAEAEDITETVFFKAWQALQKKQKRTAIKNFRAWVYRIAHNQVVEHHRSKKPTARLDEDLSLSDPNPSPDAVFQSSEESHMLAKTIKQLEPKFQEVLICRFVNQLSHKETAQILNIKTNHVRVLQYRALKKMEQMLVSEKNIDE